MKCNKYIILSAMALMAVSCSDTWDDHYGEAQTAGKETLLQLVENNPQLSDFKKVLDVTHIYNNSRRTKVTYADLLASDQTLTVWAPVNGSFNVDSLLDLCQTVKGDSSVAQHFVSNHISRNLYNMNSKSMDDIKMLNDKFIGLTPTSLGSGNVLAGNANIPATNGILHVIDKETPYMYNVYELITSLPQYAHMGNYMHRLETQKLDEASSIVAYIENGEKVYSDSVMYKYNTLFRVFDNIDSEDSTFMMLAPTKEIWDEAYAEASMYYDYGNIEKADSVSEYWTTVSLMKDLIYNCKVQKSMADSLFSTSANMAEWPYHVYYDPYSEDGLITRSQLTESVDCSNGVVFNMGAWPFSSKDIYFRPIWVETEYEYNLRGNTLCTFNRRVTNDDRISNHSYLDIVASKSTSNWTATFDINNTLSGTYDICAVVLPKTAYLANSKDTKPNKFVATLNYVDKEGKTQKLEIDEPIVSSGTDIDTLKICRFKFPVCNYGQLDCTVSLTIQCQISARETKYSREMFLDCIYLRPVTDEDIANENAAAAIRRKEDNK